MTPRLTGLPCCFPDDAGLPGRKRERREGERGGRGGREMNEGFLRSLLFSKDSSGQFLLPSVAGS